MIARDPQVRGDDDEVRVEYAPLIALAAAGIAIAALSGNL
jgi:hypothetical protein